MLSNYFCAVSFKHWCTTHLNVDVELVICKNIESKLTKTALCMTPSVHSFEKLLHNQPLNTVMLSAQ